MESTYGFYQHKIDTEKDPRFSVLLKIRAYKHLLGHVELAFLGGLRLGLGGPPSNF